MNTSRNPILLGQAETIDLLLPAVRAMLQRQGIYLASDSARPGFTVPLVVNADGVWSMKLDGQLDPEGFKDTVQLAGPFYAPGEAIAAADPACTCPSGDGSLRYPCPMHANECTAQPTAAPGIDLAELWHLTYEWVVKSNNLATAPLFARALRDCAEELRKALALIDASPKGGSDVVRGVTVERLEDMSVRGRLKLYAEDDGDMCLMVVENDGTSAGIEFCASGGRSPRTLEAVRALSRAMEQDNAERPIKRLSCPEVQS